MATTKRKEKSENETDWMGHLVVASHHHRRCCVGCPVVEGQFDPRPFILDLAFATPVLSLDLES